jgi:hypothetical protein
MSISSPGKEELAGFLNDLLTFNIGKGYIFAAS